jgi:phosphoribosylaminoimidazole-succinocarboxamide synthase
MTTAAVLQISVTDLNLIKRGKVRDVYEVDDDRLLIVATDRISAFDCILPTAIERKGEVLTSLSKFWFEKLAHIVPNHFITIDQDQMPNPVQRTQDLKGRSMLVRRAEVFPVECVVRGYLVGSGWKDYLRTGEVCGHELPENLPESAELQEPILLRQPKPRKVTMKTLVRIKCANCWAQRLHITCVTLHCVFTMKLAATLAAEE